MSRPRGTTNAQVLSIQVLSRPSLPLHHLLDFVVELAEVHLIGSVPIEQDALGLFGIVPVAPARVFLEADLLDGHAQKVVVVLDVSPTRGSPGF